MERYEPHRRGESLSLSIFYPDIPREHHPPVPHAFELPSHQRPQRLLGNGLRFHRRLSLSCLLRQLLLGSYPLHSHFLFSRLPHWRHLVTGSYLRLHLLLLSFLFSSHRSSLPSAHVRNETEIAVWQRHRWLFRHTRVRALRPEISPCQESPCYICWRNLGAL